MLSTSELVQIFLPVFLVLCLLVVGGLIALRNFLMVFARKVSGRPTAKIIPIVGGLALFIGLFFFPNEPVRLWAVLGLFIDVGCMPYLIYSVVKKIRNT